MFISHAIFLLHKQYLLFKVHCQSFAGMINQNSERSYFLCLRSWVHPRSRGEYFIAEKPSVAMEGSPPLTRGIHSYMAGICYRVRFTPAHAGNTCVHNRTIGRRWVHPRSRREYTRSLTRADLAEGSPPLTRGILSGNVRLTTSLRFTPAHAGNTHQYA